MEYGCVIMCPFCNEPSSSTMDALVVGCWLPRSSVRGIYDLHIIELKHVPFLETLPEGEMIELQAS